MSTTGSEAGGQLDGVTEAMERSLREKPETLRELAEGIVASLERAKLDERVDSIDLDGTDLEPADFGVGSLGSLGSLESVEDQLVGGPIEGAENQIITAKAYPWGFRFTIPESAMKEFTDTGDVVAAFMSLGGAAIVASGGALGPVVVVVAAYVAAELAWMKAVDRGKGVYLNGPWVAPAAIVPTAI